MNSDRSIPGLSESDIERATRPPKEAWTLPPAAYTDRDLHDRETTKIMRKSWLPLARVEQLAEPGSYLTMELLGQPILIVRGADGAIRVLANVCRHRGATIADGAGKRSVFTCPYHAWSYDTTGQLVRAPLMENACGFDEASERLSPIHSEIWQGFVMATLAENAEPFAEQIQGFDSYFKPFRLHDLVLVDTLEFDSHWNWKVLVENFMEAYHHIATHSQTLEPVFHAADSRVPDNDGPWSILHMPAADTEHAGGGPLPSVPGLQDWQARDLFATVIYPHFLLGIQASSVVWYQVLPHTVDHFTLRIHVLVPSASIRLPGFDEIKEGLKAIVSAIHQEDIAANDRVWKGLQSPLAKPGRLAPLEKAIWQQNQWWLSQLSS